MTPDEKNKLANACSSQVATLYPMESAKLPPPADHLEHDFQIPGGDTESSPKISDIWPNVVKIESIAFLGKTGGVTVKADEWAGVADENQVQVAEGGNMFVIWVHGGTGFDVTSTDCLHLCKNSATGDPAEVRVRITPRV